jgi:hypothetical protein
VIKAVNTMKKLYFVFECDSHRSYDSFKIEFATSNKRDAIKFYNKNKGHYKNEQDYFYNLAEYVPDFESDGGHDFLQSFDMIRTTEN